MNVYEEAAQAAEQNKTSVKEELKYINDYIADSYEYIFRDENDEIQHLISCENTRKNANFLHNSTYTRGLIKKCIENEISKTDKYFCVVLQKYGKVIAVVSNCTMYISKKCTTKDVYMLREMIRQQIGETSNVL